MSVARSSRSPMSTAILPLELSMRGRACVSIQYERASEPGRPSARQRSTGGEGEGQRESREQRAEREKMHVHVCMHAHERVRMCLHVCAQLTATVRMFPLSFECACTNAFAYVRVHLCAFVRTSMYLCACVRDPIPYFVCLCFVLYTPFRWQFRCCARMHSYALVHTRTYLR